MKICRFCRFPYWFKSEIDGVCIGCANLKREFEEFERLHLKRCEQMMLKKDIPGKLKEWDGSERLLGDVTKPAEVIEAEAILNERGKKYEQPKS